MSLNPHPIRRSSPTAPGLVPTLGTAELCAAAGVTRGALRLYEREGLIEPPLRTESGYRRFPAFTVDRLAEIRVARDLGFTLADIRELLRLIDGPPQPESTVRALVAERIADLDRRMQRLQRLRELLAAIEAHPGVLHDPACDLLERFADGV